MLAVRDERGAGEASASAEADLGCELVADKADHARGRKYPEVGELLRVDQPLDRLVQRDDRADEDRCNDRESCNLLAAKRAQEESDPERDRGERVAEVVNQVGEQRDASRQHVDRRLHERGCEENGERDRDCFDALPRANDGRVDKAVRMPVPTV